MKLHHFSYITLLKLQHILTSDGFHTPSRVKIGLKTSTEPPFGVIPKERRASHKILSCAREVGSPVNPQSAGQTGQPCLFRPLKRWT